LIFFWLFLYSSIKSFKLIELSNPHCAGVSKWGFISFTFHQILY
jgi:hypothetical protein